MAEVRAMNDGVYADPAAEEAVVTILATMFNGIGYMVPQTVRKNVELACEGGMSRQDRSIRGELANYCLNHSAIIVMGLVTNADFRAMVADAVALEIAYDEEEDAEEKARIRNAMSEGVGPVPSSQGNYIIDLSTYKDSLYRTLAGMLAKSVEKGQPYEDEINEAALNLTDEEKDVIGFIASNFMYLIRAFAKNRVFTGCVKSTVHKVEETLGIGA